MSVDAHLSNCRALVGRVGQFRRQIQLLADLDRQRAAVEAEIATIEADVEAEGWDAAAVRAVADRMEAVDAEAKAAAATMQADPTEENARALTAAMVAQRDAAGTCNAAVMSLVQSRAESELAAALEQIGGKS